jgi:hypothetical protein
MPGPFFFLFSMEFSISRREWLIATGVAILLAALLTVPYLLGYGLARPGSVYSGSLMNAEDTQSYFAKMNQGYEGRWLYQIPFTPEPHQGAFVGGFYLALGHLAAIINITVPAVWHGARFFSGIILFLTTFIFTATFLPDRQSRWIAYLLAITGSGLGWLLFATGRTLWLGEVPVDFRMPEAHLFFSALTFPHVALGTATMMTTFWLILHPLTGRPNRWCYSFLSGLANLVLAIFYPFMIYPVVAVVGLYWLFLCYQNREILWGQFGPIALSFIVPAPLLIYYAVVLQENAVFRAWAEQSVTLSPPWPHYLLAYGPLIILALLTVLRRQRRQEMQPLLIFLWFWVGVAVILLYSPVNQQRRYVQGLQVPLTILATVGLVAVVLPWLRTTRSFQKLSTRPRYSPEKLERFVLFIILLVMSQSNIYLLADISVTAAVRQPFPFFRSEMESQAMDWLKATGDETKIVMTSAETGNFLAAQVGNPVVLGHWAETVDFATRRLEAEQFYAAATNDEWRKEFLSGYGVSYVWYGPQERRLGDFEPEKAAYLYPVYQEAQITIFSVR